MKKRLLILICLLALAAAMMSGCDLLDQLSSMFSGGVSEKDMQIYVQGYLDKTYLGSASDEYKKLLEMTDAEVTSDYLQGLEAETSYFEDYFLVDALSDTSHDAIMDMYAKLYSYSKYSIDTVTKSSDGSFTVVIKVSPVDVLYKVVDEDWDAFSDDFFARQEDGEFDDMDTYQYDDEWISGILDMIYTRMDNNNVGYAAEQILTLRITTDEDDYFTLTTDDVQKIDNLILQYY